MSLNPRTRLLAILFTLLSAAAAGLWYWTTKSESVQEKYKTQAVDRGDIVQVISANGTLNPVVLVNVGTQVSGTAYKLHADFNDPVKAGQILVELDPSLFQAQLRLSEANVSNARATLELAKNRMTRNRALREQGFISAEALDYIRTTTGSSSCPACGKRGATGARPHQSQLQRYPFTNFGRSDRT